DDLDPELIRIISIVETRIGKELQIVSGVRCKECNQKIGGVPNSAHLRGKAVDIAIPDSHSRYLIVEALISLDIKRIGIGDTFIHCDIDETLPQKVIWLYY
ncbi:MAG: D-Ala-D-Ala carboxypeptidase family metallohydrolase, partial [Endomicrobiia bacterium]